MSQTYGNTCTDGHDNTHLWLNSTTYKGRQQHLRREIYNFYYYLDGSDQCFSKNISISAAVVIQIIF